jgi:hypothetical protein
LQNIIPTPQIINKLNGFGPLYIINLKRRTDRYDRMMNLINKNNITDYTFIEAVDGNENIDHLIDNIEQKHRSIPRMSEIATTISHIKAIEHWINTSDTEYAIFAEDDLSDETIPHWNWTWEEFISSIDFEYDVFQLCLTQFTKINYKVHKRMTNDYSAGLYILKRKHAQDILDRMIYNGKYKVNDQRSKVLADHTVIFGNTEKAYSCGLFTYNVDTKSDVNPSGASLHKKSRDSTLMFWEKDNVSLDHFIGKLK